MKGSIVASNISPELKKILDLLGRDKVEEIVDITGGRKLSLKPLKDYIVRLDIEKAIDTTNIPLSEIAKQNKVCLKTVQRIMKLRRGK